jgi:hypothetical protein
MLAMAGHAFRLAQKIQPDATSPVVASLALVAKAGERKVVPLQDFGFLSQCEIPSYVTYLQ